MPKGDEDTRMYTVVVNHEEQYSIILSENDMPLGWRAVGKTGTKADCLAYIEETWTDMRPLSVRKNLASLNAGAKQQPS